AVLEIATDKVDSEVPSEVTGVLVEKLFNVDDVVQVGQVIAIIETEGQGSVDIAAPKAESVKQEPLAQVAQTVEAAKETVAAVSSSEDRFYSPLVKNIAKEEGISQAELDTISGTGKDGRVTKNDILAHLESRKSEPQPVKAVEAPKAAPTKPAAAPVVRSEARRVGKEGGTRGSE